MALHIGYQTNNQLWRSYGTTYKNNNCQQTSNNYGKQATKISKIGVHGDNGLHEDNPNCGPRSDADFAPTLTVYNTIIAIIKFALKMVSIQNLRLFYFINTTIYKVTNQVISKY